jgi:lipopolysaccharide biosynthesis glycosyltransferase
MTDSANGTMSERGALPSAEHVHVVFCADRSYMQHGAVAAVSILENSPGTAIRFHYVTCDEEAEAEAKLAATIARYPGATLEFHRVDEQRIARAFADRHVTRAAYLRFLAPEMLPADIERIVYIDCDVVVVDDIRKLAGIDLQGRAVGATPDADWTQGAPDQRLLALGLGPEHSYVLSGMLVMDLVLWRRQDLTRRIFECVDRLGGQLAYHDQDAFNVALGNEIHLIDKRWNLQALAFGRWFRHNLPAEHRDTAAARKSPGVIHYSTADKPWLFRSRARKRALYFRYLDRTAWRGARPPLETRAARLEYDVARVLIRAGIDLYAVPHFLQRVRRRLDGASGRGRLGMTRGAGAPAQR